MKRKQWGQLSILLLWLLGGCGVWPPMTPATSALPTAGPTQAAPPATPTATPEARPRLLTLTLWAPDFLNPYAAETGAETLNAQLATFSASHPDIQIQVIVKKSTGAGGLYNMLSTASKAAPTILPDLIILGQDDLRAAAQEGLIIPLDEFVTFAEDYFPAAVTTQQVASGTYGIPLLLEADQMVYRGGIAATPPLSWTGVLTSNTSMLFPAGPPNGQADDALLAMYLGAGGVLVDEEGNPTLDRNVLETLYRFFAAMMEDNLMDARLALQLPDAAACWEHYQQGIGQFSPAPAGRYWIAPPLDSHPSWTPSPEGQPTGLAHIWSLALVTQDARRQATALELAQWLAAPARTAELNRAVGLLPPRAEALTFWTLLPEETEFLRTWLNALTPAPPPSIDLQIRASLQSGLRALLEGNVSTPEAAAAHALTSLRQ